MAMAVSRTDVISTSELVSCDDEDEGDGRIQLMVSTIGGRSFNLLMTNSSCGYDVKQKLTENDSTLRVSAMHLLYQNQEIEDSLPISNTISGGTALLALLLAQPPACAEFLLSPDSQSLRSVADPVLEDKECVLARVRLVPLDLGHAPLFQNDREVVLTAVKIDGCALQFASEDIRDDIEVLLAAIESKAYCLPFASLRLQSIPEIGLLQKTYRTCTWTRQMAHVQHKCNMSYCALLSARCLLCIMDSAIVPKSEIIMIVGSVCFPSLGCIVLIICAVMFALGSFSQYAVFRVFLTFVAVIVLGLAICLLCHSMLRLECLSACVKSKLVERARTKDARVGATVQV